MVGLTAVALAACSSGGGSATAAGAHSSRELAQRLDDAGQCRRVEKVTGEDARIAASIGIRGAWQCVMPLPPDGSTGGSEVMTWVAASTAAKTRALDRIVAGFHRACAAGGTITTRFIDGGRWLALIGINARIARVRPVLHGHFVLRRCGDGAPRGS